MKTFSYLGFFFSCSDHGNLWFIMSTSSTVSNVSLFIVIVGAVCCRALQIRNFEYDHRYHQSNTRRVTVHSMFILWSDAMNASLYVLVCIQSSCDFAICSLFRIACISSPNGTIQSNRNRDHAQRSRASSHSLLWECAHSHYDGCPVLALHSKQS